MYDVTDRESFENIANWTEQIKLVCANASCSAQFPYCSVVVLLLCVDDGLVCVQHADEGVSKVLIGNKADMVGKIQVTPEEGADLARKFGIPFFLTSAKTNMNVTEVLSASFAGAWCSDCIGSRFVWLIVCGRRFWQRQKRL